MKSMFGIGIAAAAIAVAASVSPVSAGGLFERGARGSIKDGYVPHIYQHRSAGNCYMRGDIGYSVSGTPEVTWPVSNEVAPGVFQFAGDTVSNVQIDDTWVGEIGVGCGSGSRGFRFDFTLGYRGDRNIDGEPVVYQTIAQPVIDDPLHTSVATYTGMVNVYYDFGQFRNFVPYVGAGVGIAYHMLDEVYFTENPNLLNRIQGNNDATLTWPVQAGTAYQISDRAVLDFGYRYIDLGRIKSGRVDSAGFVNPVVRVDDLYAHEFKVGLRYHFGSASSPIASLK